MHTCRGALALEEVGGEGPQHAAPRWGGRVDQSPLLTPLERWHCATHLLTINIRSVIFIYLKAVCDRVTFLTLA